MDAPEDVIARQRDAAALAAGDLTAEVIRQGVVEVNPRWSDRVETWVQLTADELYADYCNHGDGPRVLARALRLGYQRGVEDRSQSVVASDAWDAKSRAD
ncbi:MAG: hypothetical protein ACREJC_23125 [Tepidisphaeraceae bacterium]